MNTGGNTILITGGSRGIGFEFAKQFIALGNAVIVTGRDEANLKKAKELLPALKTIKSDASRPEDIAALLQTATSEFPKLNVLINNAGVSDRINLHDESIGLDALTREID